MMARKRLIIIDSNILIHRAYHALPPLKNKKGELTNAIYGFLLVFFRAIREFQPNYLVAVFDTAKPTFRHKAFDGYKAQRPPTPEGLSAQIPKIKTILEESSIAIFEKEGFEADDIIGTIAKLALNEDSNGLEVIILSCDLDMLQLVNGNTFVCTFNKGFKDMVLYDKEKVKERYEIPLASLVDFRALKGDPSDNIPGVEGVGEKTAISLLKNFHSLDNLYGEIQDVTEKTRTIKPALKERLIRDKDQAFMSRELSVIKQDVPINFRLENCGFHRYNRERAAKALDDMGFRSLVGKLP